MSPGPMNNFFKNKNLDDTLNDKYPEILESIRREGYNLDIQEYDILQEIKFEDKVVGFVTFARFSIAINQFAITEAYIIPEYRGNNLFYKLLHDLLVYDNFEYYFKKPTRALMNVLLKNDYAFKLTSDIIVSKIKFIVSTDEIYKNPKIKRFYKNTDSPIPFKANLFDTNLCSVLVRDTEGIMVRYANFFAITEPRKYDLKKYKCRKKLKRVSEKYIDDAYDTWEFRYDEIQEFIDRKERETDESLDINIMLGSDDELTEDFIRHLNRSDLSEEAGFKIRRHVIDALERGELSRTSTPQRVTYLLANYEDIDNETGEYDESTEECPFCGNDIPDFARSCLHCGLSVRDHDFEEFAMNQFQELIEGIDPEGLIERLFEDKIPVSEDDELYELKTFYNEHMVEYEFEEFLEFYNNIDKDLEIPEIMDLFIDMKFEKALGTSEEYDTYLTQLIHYAYYYIHIKDYDESLVNLMQLSILASNKSTDKNDILESNPHSLDIVMICEKLFDEKEYDFESLFDKAINTFKLPEYNNNHDEVLAEIREYLTPS